MKYGYLCINGHLTVGERKENLKGGIFKKIYCIHCNSPASLHEEHTLSESVPIHFEFYLPEIIEDKNQQEIIDGGYLLIRPIEDPIIIKEFQSTKAISKLAVFLLENIEEVEKKEDIVDTAISLLTEYFKSKKAMKLFAKKVDPNLN